MRQRVSGEICWRCGGVKERLPGCGDTYCRSCGDRENAVIASDLRRRQRRRGELKKLLPELFRAYHVPPDVVGVCCASWATTCPGRRGCRTATITSSSSIYRGRSGKVPRL